MRKGMKVDFGTLSPYDTERYKQIMWKETKNPFQTKFIEDTKTWLITVLENGCKVWEITRQDFNSLWYKWEKYCSSSQ